MMKVFLVEDEFVVREGIKNNINWASPTAAVQRLLFHIVWNTASARAAPALFMAIVPQAMRRSVAANIVQLNLESFESIVN